MWTSLHLSVIPVWDEVQWTATCVWRDDLECEPVTLVKAGRAPARGLYDPESLLRAAIAALQAERTKERAQQRDG